jgi:catechol 2,3-dioxygenase-like lactoylglutathione lyase family enzyme
MKIHGLHHNAYRCRDSEETRAFYEDFLGLPLSEALPIEESKTGRAARALHTFYRMEDGSFLAFFEVPDASFEFRDQHDYDLHIALETSPETSRQMTEKARAEGREVRGPVDHGMGHSVYFRDPNGYVIELFYKSPQHDDFLDPAKNGARSKLDRWQSEKRQGTGS